MRSQKIVLESCIWDEEKYIIFQLFYSQKQTPKGETKNQFLIRAQKQEIH